MTIDVVDLIMQDHREVERLFDELRNHPEKRRNLVPVLTTLLTAHSRAEEATVYPAAKTEAGETEEVAHSQEEHAEAEQLLERLGEANPESGEFDKLLEQVMRSINHHVQEEESDVLPGMKERLSDQRRAELGEAFIEARKRHLGQQPGEATKEQLQSQARNLGVPGAAGMSREELERETKP
ncbi:MAG TPA: hemerythrin domain-containing protein [Micromonosporaceae bacterium]|nr:hemerythrin domain-containing protein [Micromonosporaceae bacterium]